MKTLLVVTGFLFLLTRFFFMADYPHFFDSPEYFRESLSPNFFEAIANSHESVHPVYLFLIRFFQGLISQRFGPEIWPLSFVSAIFGLVAFGTFYLLLKEVFKDERKTALGLLPLVFFPHLWLIQTNVMHEAVGQAFFLLGLLLFVIYLKQKRFPALFLSIISFSLSFFNAVVMLVWLPVLIGFAVYLSSEKRELLKNLFWFLFVSLLSFLISVVALYGVLYFSIPDPLSRLESLIISGGGLYSFQWETLTLLRMVRNTFVVSLYGYSPAVTLSLGLLLGYFVLKRKWRLLFLAITFLSPFVILNKYLYAGLFGRHGALIAYGFAFLLAQMPWKRVYWLTMVLLVIFFLPTFLLYRQEPVPNLQKTLIGQIGLKENDLLILSDHQRPQLPLENTLYLNSLEENRQIIRAKIKESLEAKRRVFISTQALTFPYWQYDGQELLLLSRGDPQKAHLSDYFGSGALVPVVQREGYPLLTIYQLF